MQSSDYVFYVLQQVITKVLQFFAFIGA